MERIIKLLSIVLLCAICGAGFGQGYRSITKNSDLLYHTTKSLDAPDLNGYLEHLPPDYYDNPTKKYPMIIFLHGLGERGNGEAQLYKAAKHGPPKEVERLGSLCFTVNGEEECFIVLSPQLNFSHWSDGAQEPFWDHVYNGPDNYRFDPDRVYLTGLSLGGNGVWRRSYNANNSPNRLAAMAPVAGWGNNDKGCIAANREIPIWAFHGINDGTVNYERGYSMFTAVDRCADPSSPTTRIFTTIQGGHGIWSDIYKPDNSIRTPNLYQWFLTQNLNGSSEPANVNPVVDAGQDIETSDMVPQVTITAQASDSDGTIASYNWQKLSGPSVTISNANQATVTLRNLNEGEYTFRVTVVDNLGATASDEVEVNVTPFVIENVDEIVTKTSSDGLNYLEYLPADYETSSDMPLIIYLHTATAEGTSPTVILQEGPMKFLNEGSVLSTTEQVVVVAPQIVSGEYFRKSQISNFYDYLLNEYKVDPNRIYIIGADEGATDLAYRLRDTDVQPDRWAAAALIASNTPASIGCLIGNTDVNLFVGHSDADEKYSYTKAQSLFDAVDGCNNADMLFQDYSGNHDTSMDNAFDPNTSNLYSWLLSHSLGESAPRPSSFEVNHKMSGDGQPYLEYLPTGYDQSSTYPALVYLHSKDAEGTNLNLIKNEGPFYYIDNGNDLCVDGECYLVFAPQIPVGSSFQKRELLDFYNYLSATYNLDLDRMYIVGADEGASDLTFRLGDNNGFPDKWAAAALVAGNGPASSGCIAGRGNVNLYSAHSSNDEVYDYTKAQNLFNAIDGCSSGLMEFQSLSGNHNTSIRNAFDPNSSNLYAWLLDKTLGGGSAPAPPVPGTITERISSDNAAYLEYLPPGYDPSQEYPVLVYFISENVKSNNLSSIRNEGPFYFADNGKEICVDGECFIVLAPQIDPGSGFWKGRTDRFYDYIISEYNVDQDRIYLSGFGDGGSNALVRIADDTNSPNRWAAAAAAGYKLDQLLACNIAASGANFYLSHSQNDEVNSFSKANSFATSLDFCGSQEVIFNVLTGDHQQTWRQVFDPETSDLYSWLLGETLSLVPNNTTVSNPGITLQRSINGVVVTETLKQKDYTTNSGILEMTSPSNEAVRIRILDINGRIMIDEKVQSSIDVTGLKTAVYIYMVTDENDIPIQRGKILRL